MTAETGAQRMEWHMEAFINVVMIFMINEIIICFDCRNWGTTYVMAYGSIY